MKFAFKTSHFLVGSCHSVLLVVFSHCHSFCVHTGDHFPNVDRWLKDYLEKQFICALSNLTCMITMVSRTIFLTLFRLSPLETWDFQSVLAPRRRRSRQRVFVAMWHRSQKIGTIMEEEMNSKMGQGVKYDGTKTFNR